MRLLRSMFDPDVLMSGVAMVRDILRALQLKQVDGNRFFTEAVRFRADESFLSRAAEGQGEIQVAARSTTRRSNPTTVWMATHRECRPPMHGRARPLAGPSEGDRRGSRISSRRAPRLGVVLV
jgi:hypothetical protein